MVENFGYGDLEDELIKFDDLTEKMRSKLVDEFLIN